MEVILLDKVINLGGLGDHVRVKAGYARNFLIPKGKAVPATRQNSALFEARRAELRAELARTMAAAQVRLEQLKALERVTITAKAGEEGKLFGSIGIRDIANAITAAGIEIKKQEIKLPHGLLRTVGEHEVDCQLHSEIHTRLKVHVVANI